MVHVAIATSQPICFHWNTVEGKYHLIHFSGFLSDLELYISDKSLHCLI